MKTYCIKPDYQHRTENVTFESSAGSYWNSDRVRATLHNQAHTYHEAARLIRSEGLRSVMDVGCGVGMKLVNIIEPVAERCVGVDQPNAIDYAHRLFPDTKAELRAVNLESEADTQLGQFDLIISADVIEHLLDPDMLLRFIRAHCHENTYVLVSTPERDVRRGADNCKSPKPEHVREWNRRELKEYFESSGFEVIDQKLLPGFKIDGSLKYLKERVRLLRKGIPYRYCQLLIARPKAE